MQHKIKKLGLKMNYISNQKSTHHEASLPGGLICIKQSQLRQKLNLLGNKVWK